MTRYWGGTRHLFLLTLYDSKNIGGGGPTLPAPRSLFSEHSFIYHTIKNYMYNVLSQKSKKSRNIRESERNVKENLSTQSTSFIASTSSIILFVLIIVIHDCILSKLQIWLHFIKIVILKDR